MWNGLIGLGIPARYAVIREIVGREGLTNATALNTMGQNLWQLMGPATAGFIIDGIGFEAVYYIMVAAYIAGATWVHDVAWWPGNGNL